VTSADRFDVVIAGGGLSGLTLAIQLRQDQPERSVLVIERQSWPVPEAAHKVGESSVEIASHYFENVLGLRGLLDAELRKFGLRFFMSEGENRNIESRIECGPSHFLYVPSYQIDRGQFENSLAAHASELGVVMAPLTRVTEVGIDSGEEDHRLTLRGPDGEIDIAARWMIDASGRAGLLRKKWGTARKSRHRANAAWFRIDTELDLNALGSDPSWLARTKEPRWLSTNHLMGPGYWVWLIPLANGRTSVGIVGDANLHPFANLSTFDAARQWLVQHEPQVSELVEANLDRKLDFRAMKQYAHGIDQVYSADRWAIIGDAGIFNDPLYSPGSDFIAMGNTLITDMISRDHAGEPLDAIAPAYDQLYRSLNRTFLVTYHRNYPVMGHPRIMVIKFLWDFVMYWGGPALIFCRDQLTNADFMTQAESSLQRFAALNVRMQAFFREWSEVAEDAREAPAGVHVDYAEIECLARLNKALLERMEAAGTLVELAANVELAGEVQNEICATITQEYPKLAPLRGTSEPTTDHFGAVLRALYPGAAG